MKKENIFITATSVIMVLIITAGWKGQPGNGQEIIYREKQMNSLSEQSGKEFIAGDFHQHTTYTDGSWSIGYVMGMNNRYNLDWWANSEHGGIFSRDGAVSGNDLGRSVEWHSYDPDPVRGVKNMSGMWRWQSLAEYSFSMVVKARQQYPSKVIIQGLEWNVPGHEHASTCILADQFSDSPDALPLAGFEYRYDNRDTDTSGGYGKWSKSTLSGHARALEAIRWLQAEYGAESWVIPAHPERKGLYSVSDFRDMNNAGPDVCFGFESMPGHQKSAYRGEYNQTDNCYGSCTYGGTGLMAAKVGGLWDALLSEGRRWWLFANSDFHDITEDFLPGEYQKTFVRVGDRHNPVAILDGLRSGNVFVVTGDLIDYLDFNVSGKTMGQVASVKGKSILIKILVHDPSGANNNTYSNYRNPLLNHIDIIGGKVTGIIKPGDPGYDDEDVTATTGVIARFDARGGNVDSNGLKSIRWKELGDGMIMITFRYLMRDNEMFFRLRGTNLGLNIAGQTDGAGNPLPDVLEYPNDGAKAFADLWFYSNPVYVRR